MFQPRHPIVLADFRSPVAFDVHSKFRIFLCHISPLELRRDFGTLFESQALVNRASVFIQTGNPYLVGDMPCCGDCSIDVGTDATRLPRRRLRRVFWEAECVKAHSNA